MKLREMLEHLLVFSWNGIDVIKKLHLCPVNQFFNKKKLHIYHSRRTLGDAITFFIKLMLTRLLNNLNNVKSCTPLDASTSNLDHKMNNTHFI